jgi:hypothetical protein
VVDKNVTVLIFSCEGREHLLQKTFKSFRNASPVAYKSIVALDGPYENYPLSVINPDIIVQNFSRKGYISNIINAVMLVKTPYFFWLEDDWSFPHPFFIEELIEPLERDEKILQVVLSKYDANKEVAYTNDYSISPYGFSANPCVCRTETIIDAFTQLVNLPKDESTKLVGFENYVTSYMYSAGLSSILKFRSGKAFVNHTGELESTAREYHMINSIDVDKSSINKEYISGFGYENKVTLSNKIFMAMKIFLSSISLAIKLLSSRKAYDFAFRFYQTFQKTFKN